MILLLDNIKIYIMIANKQGSKKMYEITAYHKTGDVAYNVVANTEQQMVQEVKDALRDGFLALVSQTQTKGE